jgi:O-antigen ligase
MSLTKTTHRTAYISGVLLLAVLFSMGWGILVSRSAFLGLIFLFGAAYTVLVFFRPFYATVAFVFALPFGPFLNIPFTRNGYLLSLAVVQIAFVVWATKALLARDDKFVALSLINPVCLLMVAFLITMALSLVNTNDVIVSLRQIKRFTYYVIIYIFVVGTVENKQRFKIVVLALVGSYFFVALFGLVEAISGKLIYEFFGNRSLFRAAVPEMALIVNPAKLNGPMGNAEFHSFRMITFLIFMLCPFFLVRSRLKKVFISLLILLALINIIGTSYRGAVLGLTVAVATFFFGVQLRHKWIKLAAGLVLTLLLGFSVYVMFPHLSVERVVKLQGKEAETVHFRKRNALIGLKMALDHPIIGNGPDGFMLKYKSYSNELPQAHYRAVKAHNTYVQVLCEYGALGLLVFGLVIFLTLRNVSRLLKKTKGSDHFFVVALYATLTAHVAMMIGGNMLLDDNWWLLVAMAAAAERIYSAGNANRKQVWKESNITRQVPRKSPLTETAV